MQREKIKAKTKKKYRIEEKKKNLRNSSFIIERNSYLILKVNNAI